jgi:hypothetical protein
MWNYRRRGLRQNESPEEMLLLTSPVLILTALLVPCFSSRVYVSCTPSICHACCRANFWMFECLLDNSLCRLEGATSEHR